tara:strand:- start:321 stop:479 length:159 start_codon:yes stop_codon:yes gene_type:complete
LCNAKELQDKILFTPKKQPRKKPCLFNANNIKEEQDVLYMQDAGNRGEIHTL